MKNSDTMNYFEIKFTNPKSPDDFLDIKGTTFFTSQQKIIAEYSPDFITGWDYIFRLFEDMTTEDILRYQLKTAL